eukprot:UN11223
MFAHCIQIMRSFGRCRNAGQFLLHDAACSNFPSFQLSATHLKADSACVLFPPPEAHPTKVLRRKYFHKDPLNSTVLVLAANGVHFSPDILYSQEYLHFVRDNRFLHMKMELFFSLNWRSRFCLERTEKS